MKKSFKSFVAAGLAGVMSLTSTIGAFAANNTPVYELNETKHIVVNFIHGEYGTENFNAGYTNCYMDDCLWLGYRRSCRKR